MDARRKDVKISFDRRAYEGETRVLTSFEQKMEIVESTTMQALVEQYVFRFLGLADLPPESQDWNLIAVKNMQYRSLARIRYGEIQWVDSAEITVREFFGLDERAGIIGMTTASIAQQKEQELDALIPGQWQEVELPIRIDTKNIRNLALFVALISLISFIAMILHFQDTKEVLAELFVVSLIGVITCYFILLQGRKISFNEHIVVYRNRFNRYERFTPEQFDHLEWFGPKRDIKFVFKYEEKSRNFISTNLKNNFKLILWAKSQGIGIYSSNP